LQKSDLVEITKLKLVAYGNTKYDNGKFSCQHGAGECTSDALELCTQYKLSGDINSIQTGDTSLDAWPFILCMEEADGNPNKGKSCFDRTMSNSTLEWSTVETCYNKEYDLVQSAAQKATPTHDYVPWVLVDGDLLENTDLLQKAVCDAYTGTPPQSCKQLSGSKSSRCYPDKL